MADKKIVRLFEEKKEEALEEMVRGMDDTEITGLVDQRATRGKGDPVVLVRALFAASPASHNNGIQRRLLLFKHCIKLLKSSEVNSKMAAEMIGLLLLETDAFPSRTLAILANFYVDLIKTGIGSSGGKCLELFPKILSAVEGREVVQYGENTTKGTEFKGHILNSLCSGRWEAGTVIHLAAMFKDLTLSSEELGHVIHKIMRMFKEVDLQELPPLVYQLLLLANKGHKRQVLEGVSRFFVEQDKADRQRQAQGDSELSEVGDTSEHLRHVEGTVLLHVTFAVKQDQELGREFIKYIKTCQPSVVLAPFNVALALSISRIHRFEEQICEFIKATVVRSYRDAEKQAESAWVREMAPDTCDVAHQLLQAVTNSTSGWDSVVQGLVHLGFLLMDGFGPKAAFGKVVEVAATARPTPTQRACQLGADLLHSTFKSHEMVRSDILEQILNRVVTKATSPVSHFIDLLSRVVVSAPQILLDSLGKVKEALDYLSFLPPPTAHGLLLALQPLLKISMSLKDSLILVLRKAMFSRQIEARNIAVNGFLMILKHFKVLGALPTSQASQSMSLSQIAGGVDVHIPYNPASNEALCLEILGNLRRCLTQQADVRLALYEGLTDVMVHNSQLTQPVLTMLFMQFKKYYEDKEDVNPPIKLEPCILTQGETVQATEPLSHLLCCLVQCLLRFLQQTRDDDADDADDPDEGVASEVQEMVDALVTRMVTADLEDFELDKSADFSLNTSVGVKNTIFGLLVSAVYEVLMEYAFLTGNYQKNSSEQVLQLYGNYQKLADILKEKSGGGSAAGKKGRAGTSSASAGGAASSKTKSYLSIKFVALIIKALISNSTPAHQESLNLLRENIDLMRYIFGVALSRLQQIKDKGTCDGPEGHSKDKLFKYASNIARHMLKYYNEDLQTPDEGKKERGKTVVITALETLSTAVTVAGTRYTDRLHEFLTCIDPNKGSVSEEGDAAALQQLLHSQIKRFQKMVMLIVNAGDESDRSMREVLHLLAIITQLAQHLSGAPQVQQVHGWVLKVCTETDIDDQAVTKALLGLLFQLTAQQKSCAGLLKQVACDVHTRCGDIDQEVELEDSATFSVINIRTAAPTALLALLTQMDRELDDTEWVIARMKVDMAAFIGNEDAGDSGSTAISQREEQERSVCTRLGQLVTAAHELAQTALPTGPPTEAQLRVMARLYGSLTLLVKFYLSLYQKNSGHLCSRFEKLVKVSGTNLTQYIYPMITFMEATNKESLQQAADKVKKKDKKKQDAVASAGKARVMKETKSIPALIFALEQYERFLIQLTKKSKVNLMEHFKMSTSRDFRINAQSLEAAMEASVEDEEGGSEDDDENQDKTREDQENEEPPKKKQKQSQPPANSSSKAANTSTATKKSKLMAKKSKVVTN